MLEAPLLSRKAQSLFATIAVVYFFLFAILLVDLARPPYNPTIGRITLVATPFDVVLTVSKEVDRLALFALAGSLPSFLVRQKTLRIVPAACAAAAAGAVMSAGMAAGAPAQLAVASLALFALSLPLAAVPVYYAAKGRRGLVLDRQLVVHTALKVAIALEAAAIVRWLLFPAIPSPMFGDLSWRVSELETKVYYLIGFASPALLLLLTFSYLPRHLMNHVAAAASSRVVRAFQSLARTEGMSAAAGGRFPVSPRVVLACAVAASVLLPLYPYLPGVNPDFRPVSVDIFYYKPWVDTALASDGPREFARSVFVDISGGDRPLSLLLFIAVKAVTGLSVLDSLKIMPVLLTPALVLAAYYFTKVGSNNRLLASIVAAVVPVSTTVVVGIYAGFYANWIALAAMLLGLAFLLKYLATGRKRYLLALLGCTLLTLFSHNYTWSYFVSALVLFAAMYSVLHRREKKLLRLILPLAFVVALSVGADLAKMAFLQNDSGLGKEFTASTNQLSGEEYAARWRNLWYVFTIFLGGFYTNSVIYALALAWALGAAYRDNMNLALLAMTFIGAIALVAGEYSVQARVIWDMPIFVSAGIVLYSLAVRNTLASRLALVAILLHFGNYALRSLANLQFPA